jgi:hypothetical protein
MGYAGAGTYAATTPSVQGDPHASVPPHYWQNVNTAAYMQTSASQDYKGPGVAVTPLDVNGMPQQQQQQQMMMPQHQQQTYTPPPPVGGVEILDNTTQFPVAELPAHPGHR